MGRKRERGEAQSDNIKQIEVVPAVSMRPIDATSVGCFLKEVVISYVKKCHPKVRPTARSFAGYAMVIRPIPSTLERTRATIL